MKKWTIAFLSLATTLTLMSQAALAATYKVRVYVDNKKMCASEIGSCLSDNESVMEVRNSSGNLVKTINVYNRFYSETQEGKLDEEFLVQGPDAMQLSIDILEKDLVLNDVIHIGTVSIIPSEVKKVHVDNVSEANVISREYSVVRAANSTYNLVDGGKYVRIDTVAQSQVYETQSQITTKPAIRIEIQRIN